MTRHHPASARTKPSTCFSLRVCWRNVRGNGKDKKGVHCLRASEAVGCRGARVRGIPCTPRFTARDAATRHEEPPRKEQLHVLAREWGPGGDLVPQTHLRPRKSPRRSLPCTGLTGSLNPDTCSLGKQGRVSLGCHVASAHASRPPGPERSLLRVSNPPILLPLRRKILGVVFLGPHN